MSSQRSLFVSGRIIRQALNSDRYGAYFCTTLCQPAYCRNAAQVFDAALPVMN